MMSVAPVASAANAANYYSNQDNYYFLGSLQSQWLGEGAKELGLTGSVEQQAFTDVLFGKLPNGVQLGKEVNNQHVHRPGHDLTFSAPKSVSLMILIGGDKELLQAHNEAVKVAAEQIQNLVSARDTKDGVTSIVPTGKLVAAAYTHDTSRNLDPQVHTHLIVANVTELDGKWKALATDYIHKAGFIETVMAHQVTLGKLYRNALKEKVEKLGHETEIVGKHGLWEIKGVPEPVRDEFSSRGKEIETAVGVDATLRSRDVAAKDTRAAKVDPSKMRLLERWQNQMKDMGFDIQDYKKSLKPVDTPDRSSVEPDIDAQQAVRDAVSLLSDNKTRFTYSDVLLTALGSSENQIKTADIRAAIDGAMQDNLIIPLDKEKGVFASRLHLLDELSIQGLAQDMVKNSQVVAFKDRQTPLPAELAPIATEQLALLSSIGGAAQHRELIAGLATASKDAGRSVMVLASSAEKSASLKKSEDLQGIVQNKFSILQPDFSMKAHGTVIVESAEQLSLKETLVLIGHAREKDAQVIFVDGAGRKHISNAMAVLESAGVTRHALNTPSPGLQAEVISISDKQERYRALADRYAELSGGTEPVTAAVVGMREQRNLNAAIREALQDAGKLDRGGVVIEARSPVFLDTKSRKQPENYRAGYVLEHRKDAKHTDHYRIDRVHRETRMLSLIDSDGVLRNVKIRDMDSDWRLFESREIAVANGEKLLAIAGDKEIGLKAKDRLTVTQISEKGITAQLGDGKKSVLLPLERPLYIQHGYAGAPGASVNDNGHVLAALNSRELSGNTVNALAQSGTRAEIFTGEVQDKAEDKLARMSQVNTPLTHVQHMAGKSELPEALQKLNADVLGDVQKAVTYGIEQSMSHSIAFTPMKLLDNAMGQLNNHQAIAAEIDRREKNGELINVVVQGKNQYVARSAYEMEKTIVRIVEQGKGTQEPLLEQVDPTVLAGLTPGQNQTTRMLLGTKDQFILVQGSAGVGKTTQLTAFQGALQTLAPENRPKIVGLAPTHQAVKEMRAVGIEAQTTKSFIVEHDKRVTAGETINYENVVFVIDESSMVGNQDTAEAYQAIAQGSGRGISVGDREQLLSVDSGAPFQLLQERSPIDVAIMKDIVRQDAPALKAAVYDILENKVDASIGKIKTVSPSVVPRLPDGFVPASSIEDLKAERDVLKANIEKGMKIDEDKPAPAAVSRIIADYTGRTAAAREKTLIITHTNSDRRSVNEGIHDTLKKKGVLGEKQITIPVLTRVNDDRRALNQVNTFKAGQVILEGDRYLDVINVDKSSGLVWTRDENGRQHLLSPFENSSRDIAIFNRESIAVAVGDKVRFSKSNKNDGQLANETYTVSGVKDDGQVTLSGNAGIKTIHPRDRNSDRHVDYAYAVTGYGAQGTSTPYVITLEGAEGARGMLATMRSFYISTSRAKSHVQIYSDNLDKWLNKIKKPEGELLTAHDVLKPETQRHQARTIWSMGVPLNKTAIGRAWQKQDGQVNSGLAARVIPQTRKYPEPHLAFPVFDGNGKAAGISLTPLHVSQQGKIETGTPRLMVTDNAQAALIRKSRNGQTLLATSLEEARAIARDDKQSGIVWQIGDKLPSEHMVSLTKGTLKQNIDTLHHLAATIADQLQPNSTTTTPMPAPTATHDLDPRAQQLALEQARQLADAHQKQEELAKQVKPVIPQPRPEEKLPDLAHEKLMEQNAAASVSRKERGKGTDISIDSAVTRVHQQEKDRSEQVREINVSRTQERDRERVRDEPDMQRQHQQEKTRGE